MKWGGVGLGGGGGGAEHMQCSSVFFFYSFFAISLLPSPPESRHRRCDGRADGKAEGVQEETFVSVLSLANI